MTYFHSIDQENHILEEIYINHDKPDRDPSIGLLLTDFLYVYRENGYFLPHFVKKEKILHPEEFSKILHLLGLLIPLYPYIINKHQSDDPMLPIVLEELLSFSINWTFISKNLSFLRQVISNENCPITVGQYFNLWQLFHYLLDPIENSDQLAKWNSIQQFEINEHEVPLEIDNGEDVSTITQIPVRDLFLQIINLVNDIRISESQTELDLENTFRDAASESEIQTERNLEDAFLDTTQLDKNVSFDELYRGQEEAQDEKDDLLLPFQMELPRQLRVDPSGLLRPVSRQQHYAMLHEPTPPLRVNTDRTRQHYAMREPTRPIIRFETTPRLVQPIQGDVVMTRDAFRRPMLINGANHPVRVRIASGLGKKIRKTKKVKRVKGRLSISKNGTKSLIK